MTAAIASGLLIALPPSLLEISVEGELWVAQSVTACVVPGSWRAWRELRSGRW